jgi:dephospho-CoA kinase
MRVLGLTGGIGSGKSVVSAMFRELGAEVIDADQLARDVVEPGQPALEEIATAFGRDVLQVDGRLNRAKLASLVFADRAARERLNAITHPPILERMQQAVVAHRNEPGVLILDIPLLYENARAGMMEKVVVVWVDRATQAKRLMARDGLSREEAERRIAVQLPLDEKRSRADYVIDNSGSLDDTRRRVEAIYRSFQDGPLLDARHQEEGNRG